jgi:hypothetical protein
VEWGTIQSVLVDPAVTSSDREFQSRDAYRWLVSDIAEDGQVSAAEESLLTQIESTLPIGDAFAERIRADAFRRKYVDAISDGVLSRDEENALERLRTDLRVRSEMVADELAFMDRLRAIRKIREGDLSAITAPVHLPKAEICHFVSPARILKERVLRSYQQDNQRYSVHGLVIDAEGTLLITSKRILIVHGGSTSIPYNKVLELEVDADQNMFSIAKENAANPVLITAPDATMAGAIAATAAGL